MKTIKLGEKEVDLPQSWSEITFKEFNGFTKIIDNYKDADELKKEYADLDDDIKELQLSLDNVKFNTKLVSYWTKLDESEIAMCDLEDVEKALKAMEFLNKSYTPIPLSKFTFKDETYYLPEKGMPKQNFGTYIEAEQVEINNQQLGKGNLDVIPRQTAIVAKKEGEEPGLINDELVDKRAKMFEELDMATIWDVGFFLAKRESSLMTSSLIYLKQEVTRKQMLQQKEQ